MSYKYTFSQICEESKGRVLEILKYFVPSYEWDKSINHHYFCPVHGGVNGDAFRCLDNPSKGYPAFNDVPSMVCNSCHGMEPIHGLFNCIMWLTGRTDKYSILVEVAEFLKVDLNSKPKGPSITRKTYERPKPVRNAYAAERLRAEWKKALPISNRKAYSIISAYLRSRGLSVSPLPIMKLGSMEYRYKHFFDQQSKRWIYKSFGTFPVILTLMSATIDNTPLNIHRTYLDPVTFKKVSLRHPLTGRKLSSKKAMSPVFSGRTPECCMRLFNPVNGVIGVAEGIETCLAVYEATGLPMWSMANQYALRKACFGPEIKVVLPFGDLDVPNEKGVQVGVAAANELAERMRETGRESVPYLPEFDITGREKGVDWLDMLNMFGPAVFPDLSQYLLAA